LRLYRREILASKHGTADNILTIAVQKLHVNLTIQMQGLVLDDFDLRVRFYKLHYIIGR